MTKDKDLNHIGKIKSPTWTPQTQEVRYVGTEDLYPDLSQRSNKSKLSPAARQKIVNHNKPYQSLNQEEYGPCSYSGCPYSTDFDIDLTIEGNRRKWARSPGEATWLRGTWETGFWTSHYLSSWNLWLADIDEAQRATHLLVNDTIYTVNLMGVHCAEDNKFCNSALAIIRGAIAHHEQGGKVIVNEPINSDISRWSRYAFKTGAAVGAGLINPGLAIGIGATAWGAGEIGKEACGSGRGKAFWGTVGSMGGSAAMSGAVSGFFDQVPKGFCEWDKAHESSKAISFVKGCAGSTTEDLAKHNAHLAAGISRHSKCPICNA